MVPDSHAPVAAAAFFTVTITFWIGEFKVGAGFAGGAPNCSGRLLRWTSSAVEVGVVAVRACSLGAVGLEEGGFVVAWTTMELGLCSPSFLTGITFV